MSTEYQLIKLKRNTPENFRKWREDPALLLENILSKHMVRKARRVFARLNDRPRFENYLILLSCLSRSNWVKRTLNELFVHLDKVLSEADDSSGKRVVELLWEAGKRVPKEAQKILKCKSDETVGGDFARNFLQQAASGLEKTPGLLDSKELKEQRLDCMTSIADRASTLENNDIFNTEIFTDIFTAAEKLAGKLQEKAVYWEIEKPNTESRRSLPVSSFGDNTPGANRSWLESAEEGIYTSSTQARDASKNLSLEIERKGAQAVLQTKLELYYSKQYRSDKAKNYRKILNYTLEVQATPSDEAARELGVSPRTIDNWKQDHREEPLRSMIMTALKEA